MFHISHICQFSYLCVTLQLYVSVFTNKFQLSHIQREETVRVESKIESEEEIKEIEEGETKEKNKKIKHLRI